MDRVNPSYADLIRIMDQLPLDANVYSLCEPRTYALPRTTQPDLVLYNFSHDLYLSKTPDDIIRHWKSEGYTHVLVYERGLDILIETETTKFPVSAQETLGETLAKLRKIDQTSDQIYSLYQIP